MERDLMLDGSQQYPQQGKGRIWFARIAVLAVFVINVQCAIAFIIWPDAYLSSYALSGETGRVVLRSIGILFLMWNATYPPVIWNPHRHMLLFGIVLVQQLIGLVGESILLVSLHGSIAALASSLTRFIIFDGAGLVLMGIAFFLLVRIPKGQR
ncbi:MAG: hypothetical protein ACOYIK_02075 [Coriobacteriales bacterium]|jgi:hypothetical protein